jgi:hypothetical protein
VDHGRAADGRRESASRNVRGEIGQAHDRPPVCSMEASLVGDKLGRGRHAHALLRFDDDAHVCVIELDIVRPSPASDRWRSTHPTSLGVRSSSSTRDRIRCRKVSQAPRLQPSAWVISTSSAPSRWKTVAAATSEVKTEMGTAQDGRQRRCRTAILGRTDDHGMARVNSGRRVCAVW